MSVRPGDRTAIKRFREEFVLLVCKFFFLESHGLVTGYGRQREGDNAPEDDE